MFIFIFNNLYQIQCLIFPLLSLKLTSQILFWVLFPSTPLVTTDAIRNGCVPILSCSPRWVEWLYCLSHNVFFITVLWFPEHWMYQQTTWVCDHLKGPWQPSYCMEFIEPVIKCLLICALSAFILFHFSTMFSKLLSHFHWDFTFSGKEYL